VKQGYFARVYGDAVQVEYLDVSEPAVQAEYADLIRQVEEDCLPYPLVAIDGQVRLAGGAEYYRVMPLVEEAGADYRS
jgi:disulfide oxidoreductase YuzD